MTTNEIRAKKFMKMAQDAGKPIEETRALELINDRFFEDVYESPTELTYEAEQEQLAEVLDKWLGSN
jgi:hypothetical protein